MTLLEPRAGSVIGIPLEDLFWQDGMVHMRFVSQGARVTYNGAKHGQLEKLDPYKVAIVEIEGGGYAVVVWGGGGRNQAAHSLAISDKVTKVTAWRSNMSQVMTESGLTVSWSKSSQCGSCGGIPAPQGYAWGTPPYTVPGPFDMSKVEL